MKLVGLTRQVKNIEITHICIPEHANLGLDVTPFTGGAVVLGKGIIELLAHADDAVSHTLDLLFPKGACK